MKPLALIAALFTVLISAACNKPNEPTREACEVNNTGTVRFTNGTSIQGFTIYDVVWDGVRVVERLLPGSTSSPREEAAGIAHTVQFRFTGQPAALVACGASPILIRCQERTLTCTTQQQ